MVHDTFVVKITADQLAQHANAFIELQPGQIGSAAFTDMLVIVGRGDWSDIDFDNLMDACAADGAALDDLCMYAWDHAGDGEYDVWIIYTSHECNDYCKAGANV